MEQTSRNTIYLDASTVLEETKVSLIIRHRDRHTSVNTTIDRGEISDIVLVPLEKPFPELNSIISIFLVEDVILLPVKTVSDGNLMLDALRLFKEGVH